MPSFWGVAGFGHLVSFWPKFFILSRLLSREGGVQLLSEAGSHGPNCILPAQGLVNSSGAGATPTVGACLLLGP